MKLPFLITCFLLISFSGCQNASESKEYASLDMADTISQSGLTGDSVKLVKTASMHCKVKDVHQSARAVSLLAQRLGGMISHQNIEAIPNQSKELPISEDSIMVITAYTTQADVIAHIPAEHLEEFLYSIASIGYFTINSKMDIDDRSLEYLANGLKQQNRLQVSNGSPGRKMKDPSMAQLIQTKDEEVDQLISNRRIDAEVKYSTVQLNLFQSPFVHKEIIANYEVTAYSLPFNKSLSDAFYTGWAYFLNFLLVLVYLWPFIFLAIGIWMVYKYLRLRFTYLNRTKL